MLTAAAYFQTFASLLYMVTQNKYVTDLNLWGFPKNETAKFETADLRTLCCEVCNVVHGVAARLSAQLTPQLTVDLAQSSSGFIASTGIASARLIDTCSLSLLHVSDRSCH